MESRTGSWYGHRLLQVGVAFFLFSALEGFAIPGLASPRLGLSVHTLSATVGLLFVSLGLVWPRLHLGQTSEMTAFWLLLYSNVTIVAGYVMAAVWGAGNETIPLAAGSAHGSPVQETAIKIAVYVSAPGLIAFVIILWGLRSMEPRSESVR